MPTEERQTERAAGGVVVRRVPDPSVLLIHDGYGNWGHPKGHLEPGESDLQAAQREIAEETGIDSLVYVTDLGERSWDFERDGIPIHKVCRFFLYENRSGDPVPETTEGISEVEFVPVAEAKKRVTFAVARELIEAAESYFELPASSRGA